MSIILNKRILLAIMLALCPAVFGQNTKVEVYNLQGKRIYSSIPGNPGSDKGIICSKSSKPNDESGGKIRQDLRSRKSRIKSPNKERT
jgi:hypothetical protein